MDNCLEEQLIDILSKRDDFINVKHPKATQVVYKFLSTIYQCVLDDDEIIIPCIAKGGYVNVIFCLSVGSGYFYRCIIPGIEPHISRYFYICKHGDTKSISGHVELIKYLDSLGCYLIKNIKRANKKS